MDLTLTSPELTSLTQTSESLKAKARGYANDANILNQRLAAGAEDTAEDKESNIAMILAGDNIEFKPDLTAQLSTTMKQWRAVDDAQENISKRIAKAKREAATKVVAGLKPEHDAMMKRLCLSLAETHAAHVELFAMKRELIDKEVGIFNDVCELMPDFLDAPVNRYSQFADFCREAAKRGFMKSVPAQLR